MKRLFSILLAALLLFGCGSQSKPAKETPKTEAPVAQAPAETDSPAIPVPDVAGYDDFSDLLSAKLIDGTQNRNLSPVSVYLALAMTAEGAGGTTREDLLGLLGCGTIEQLRGVCGAMLENLSIDTEDSSLLLADSLWMADGEAFKDVFLKVLGDSYRSEANKVRFGSEEASRQIADWITQHTREKIKISPDAMEFDADTVAVLINTIYLKDAWRDEFFETNTEAGTFYGLRGEQTVSYMNRRDNGADIVKGDGFLRYSLPLLKVGRMTFLLPDEDVPLSSLLGTPDKLRSLLHDGETERANVNVRLPKFKFQDRADLNDVLISLGIGSAFSGGADFSNMCDGGAFISKALQESYIGVDETGVEAAAYTMIVAAKGFFMPEELPEIDFHLTRPFLYAIESYSGEVLFIGTVTEPTPAA